ncbi:MAG: FAD-dependent oxidoreductase, partial [Anaerolineae bacterium]|nr:FAD-dependent oxidoreductase [Anaerolineae bacterium]
GKGYYEYYRRAQERYGVKYTRCSVSFVLEDPETHDLVLRYVPSANGNIVEERFDMVVLSTGVQVSDSTRDLGRRVGIELDRHGFCHTSLFRPLEASREGIFAIGAFREPKDIPESVIDGSGAAAVVGNILSPARWSRTKRMIYPPERDVSSEEPRAGVFVCHCGSNIGGFLDVPSVTAYARSLPGVVFAEENLYTCSQDSIRHITEKTRELGLNRVVVASCTPLTHEVLFQDSVRQAGLNPGMFQMVNIRNQGSWVHSEEWDAATEKAKDLVRMGVAKAVRLEALHRTEIQVQKQVLVLGGGVAGMTAALTLADQGFPVYLVEKTDELGGNLRLIQHIVNWEDGTAADGDGGHLAWYDPHALLTDMVGRTESHPLITVHRQCEYRRSSGFTGSFVSQLADSRGDFELKHGATIVATGGVEYRGAEYGYGTDPRILTQQDLEGRLASGEDLPNSVVMILCVGPAERYCSRICCTVAMKNILVLQKLKPDIQITVFYHDIRTYGFKERLYREARRQGALFVRYEFDRKPEVALADGQLRVRGWEPSLGEDLRLKPDLVVLSMPVVAPEGTDELATRLRVSTDLDGFFLEAHVKLRPVDFASDGAFLAGMAHYPKFIDETMVQAQAAAARAMTIVSRDVLEVGGIVAEVDTDKCVGCLTCVRLCPYDVPQVGVDFQGAGGIVGAAYIESAMCHGCGICVAECPARAIQLLHYKDVQMEAQIDAFSQVDRPVEV